MFWEIPRKGKNTMTWAKIGNHTSKAVSQTISGNVAVGSKADNNIQAMKASSLIFSSQYSEIVLVALAVDSAAAKAAGAVQ